MPAKAPARKTTKTTQKPVKRTVKKVTWDDIQEGFRELQELHKETEKTLNKAIEEIKKANEETEKTLNKAIGGLSNTLGSLVEHIMTPDLPQKFKELGYSFNRIVTYKIAEGVHAQIDGMLENGEQAVAVEVKTTLRQADIDEHLVRMEKIRKYADEHNDKRQFMGAIAATITDKSTREYALNKGLFVIEPSGENVKVTRPMEEPRIW